MGFFPRISIRFRSVCLIAFCASATFAAATNAEIVYQPRPQDSDVPAPPDVVAPEPMDPDQPMPSLDSVASQPASGSSSGGGLGSIPKMHGDSFMTGTMSFSNSAIFTDGRVDLPVLGTGQRSKLSDDNSAIPTDRVFFIYHHFQNAIRTDTTDFLTTQETGRGFPIDRSVIGVEKTFFDDQWSIELRMPFLGSTFFDASPTSQVEGFGGQVGNLLMAVKRLIYETETGGIGVGLAFDLPTGSGAATQIGDDRFTIHNEAFHLTPFIGLVAAPNDRWFYQGMLQLDLPLNGSQIDYTDTDPSTGSTIPNIGHVSGQTMLYADASVGYWLARNPRGRFVTGIAPTLEVHYTTTLNNPALVQGTQGDTSFAFGNGRGIQNVVNFTYALHIALGERTNIRFGGVAPIGTGDNRAFDAEFQLSINHSF